MDATAAVNLISSVGFPIFMCLYLVTTMNKQMSAMTEALNSLKDRMQEMSDSDKDLKATIQQELNK